MFKKEEEKLKRSKKGRPKLLEKRILEKEKENFRKEKKKFLKHKRRLKKKDCTFPDI